MNRFFPLTLVLAIACGQTSDLESGTWADAKDMVADTGEECDGANFFDTADESGIPDWCYDMDRDGHDVYSDCDDEDDTVFPGATETCNGIDDDCDGQVDEGLSMVTTYADADGDGYGDPSTARTECSPSAGRVLNGDDCDDSRSATYPGATEVCDGADNDCDGTADEGLTFRTYYRDYDRDGYGRSGARGSTCAATPPPGHSFSAGDCHDGTSRINPGAPEVCDGWDNDCDGTVDEGHRRYQWYEDADGDGFGNAHRPAYTCYQPTNGVRRAGDCDDTDASISPGAAEVCGDGIDNDCDTRIDENKRTYYYDADGDGYGLSAYSRQECAPVGPYRAPRGLDCDDTDATTSPGELEVCGDSVDNDCDGSVDENRLSFYYDGDGDGYGVFEGHGVYLTCDPTSTGSGDHTAPRNGDCDDTDPNVHPGAHDPWGGDDRDCDGSSM